MSAEDLRAIFVVSEEENLKKKRSWENYWERNASIPTDFLRSAKAIEHPVRTFIAEQAARVGGSVLECGSATAIDYPLHKRRGLKYSALDITPKFVKSAKEFYPELDIRLGNVLNLPFEDESKDTVYCRALLEHMHPDEWPSAVVEMWRVARVQMIVALYRGPDTSGYNGDLIPPRPKKGGGMYTRKINKQHLEALLLSLPESKAYQLIITPKVDRHRANWVYIVPKKIKPSSNNQ